MSESEITHPDTKFDTTKESGRKKLARIDLDIAIDKYLRHLEGSVIYLSLIHELEGDEEGFMVEEDVSEFKKMVEHYMAFSEDEKTKTGFKNLLEFLSSY